MREDGVEELVVRAREEGVEELVVRGEKRL